MASPLPITGYPSVSSPGSAPELGEGWSAADVFTGSQALGLQELVFLPGVLCKPPSLACRLSKNMKLQSPVIANSEEGMCMGMALCGGLGIIHRHLPIREQAKKVQRVKMYNSGFILNPACLAPRHLVEDALRIQAELGCSGIPITENGRMGGRLVGLVTKRDLEGKPRTASLGAVMNRDVVLAQEPVTLKQACTALQQQKVSKLPVVNKDMELVALICRGDMKQVQRNPNASRDANRQLMVAAAASPHEGWDRVKAMVEAGADLLHLDTEEGVDAKAISFLKEMKEKFAGIDVLAGPVNSLQQAAQLCEHGADAILVGRAGGAEATVIYEISRSLRANFGVPVIADVGVQDSGQVLKALLLGASAVCLDPLVQRCEEAPGDLIYRNGVRVRLEPSPAGPRPVEMGCAAAAIDKGSILSFLPPLLQNLRTGFQDLGIQSMGDVSKALEQGVLRLERCMGGFQEEAPRMFPIVANGLHCR
ncbi:unnamed protein product [Effrenium voratum]|uniref:CBS domain-containing protein n=1 Tax=Effrenium voratum TaxID=2562239 RepID=A0AA36NDR5_9DINO|nr:unnamed protein product [Effrenium voratum]